MPGNLTMNVHFHDETTLSEHQERLVDIYRRDGAHVLAQAVTHQMPDGSALSLPVGFTYILDGDIVVPVTLTAGGTV
jgi:hypothetical protein